MKLDNANNPHRWIKHAKSNLRLAENGGNLSGVLYEDLCFNAQQAAEKALKAPCVHKKVEAIQLAARVLFWAEKILA